MTSLLHIFSSAVLIAAVAAQASAPSESTGVEHPSEAGGKAMDPETMYEYFLDRFKRDLLIEREQLGHLIIDNP